MSAIDGKEMVGWAEPLGSIAYRGTGRCSAWSSFREFCGADIELINQRA